MWHQFSNSMIFGKWKTGPFTGDVLRLRGRSHVALGTIHVLSLKMMANASVGMILYPTSSSIHAFNYGGKIGGGTHFVMNRTTEQWINANESYTNFRREKHLPDCSYFSTPEHAYKIGCVPKGDGHAIAIYRYEYATNEREKVHEWPSRKLETNMYDSKVLVNGYRVYIIGSKR
ncbi:hypothetical protein PENTCL1PPCAC_3213, partial [Pristionchus entomophagus]